MCHVPYRWFSACDIQSKEKPTNIVSDVTLFFAGRFVSYDFSILLRTIFLDYILL